jgi:hypothetical protein
MNCVAANIKLCYACERNGIIPDLVYKCYFIIDNEYVSEHSAQEIKDHFRSFISVGIDTYWLVKAIELNYPQYKDMIYKLSILQ